MDCKLEQQGCGGCQLLHMPYAEQLAKKQALVQKLLGKYAKVQPVIGMDTPEHYRCKVIASFATDKNKKLCCGLYAKYSHTVLPSANCVLENKTAAAVIQAVCKAAQACHYTAYDEDKGTGLLRHVLIRYGYATGQLMCVLVTGQDILPGSKNFVTHLRRLCPEVTTVVQNINTRRTSVVLGEKNKVLFGPGYIFDTLCGCTFSISPTSFYQVNPPQTEKLYLCAIKMAQLSGKEKILDAYCGTGTIGIVAAKHGAAQVMGVESNSDAVRNAIYNAKRNEIQNIRFYSQDAGEFLLQSSTQTAPPDVVFMDPPRTGSDERFLSALCALSPRKIVYISCSTQTQARDLDYLIKNGYKVKELQPVDMFPFTEHVECIALLTQ